jgi:hypothetical protein
MDGERHMRKNLEIRNGKTVIATLFISRIVKISGKEIRYELDLDGYNIGYINAENASVTGDETALVIANIEKDEIRPKNVTEIF